MGYLYMRLQVSNELTLLGGLNVVAYAAAKHGVQGIVKSFSNGWASKGVNVNAIAPGYISTDVRLFYCLHSARSRARQSLQSLHFQ